MGLNLNSLIIENKDISSTLYMNDVFKESCVNSMYTFLKEFNEDKIEIEKEFYRSIYESETLVGVNEAFSDLFEKIQILIQRFIDFIKKLFGRHTSNMCRLIDTDKSILKEEKTFNSFNSDCDFAFDVYDFTISDNIPNNEMIKNDIDRLSNMLDITKITGNDKKDLELIKTANKDTKDILLNGWLSQVRAHALDIKGGSINKADFGDYLFKTFRDNQTEPHTVTVNASKVKESFVRFKSYKDMVDKMNTERDDMIKCWNGIKKDLKQSFDVIKCTNGKYTISDGSKTHPTTNEVVNNFNIFTKSLSSNITEVTSIIGFVYSYKLDSLKDEYNQNKDLLNKALSAMNSKDVVGDSDSEQIVNEPE